MYKLNYNNHSLTIIKMKKTTKIILLAAMASIGMTKAQTPAVMVSDKTGWHEIGTVTVDFKRDRDEISVIGADRFAAIQFRVQDAPIDLMDLEVYYESGDKQDIIVRTPIKANGTSRVIDLNGGERNLKKIVFVYKTLPNVKDEKAQVTIWGLKTNTDENQMASKKGTTSDVAESSLVMSDKKGWHKIGERSVNFVKDHDEFVVIGADRFSSIKFKVSEASIQLISLDVFYESGDKQTIKVNSPIIAGSESKAIDLNGGERDLKKIVFEYKTLPNQTKEMAMVEVWGLKTNVVVK